MYAYRQITEEQQQEVLAYRRLMQFPLHEPPHFERDNALYLLTASNFEHKQVMAQEERRTALLERLLTGLHEDCSADVFAWVILPNHYHILARVDLPVFATWIGKLHNATSTKWNREDKTPGRTVWYRFSDRGIRNERHFWATVNYIHFNPVKHGYVEHIDTWKCSSIHSYIAEHGYEAVIQLDKNYPLYDYGKNWDI